MFSMSAVPAPLVHCHRVGWVELAWRNGRGNGLKSCQEKFRLDTRKNCFSGRSGEQEAWEVGRSPSLGVFKNCGGVALKDLVSGHGGTG